jgi:hypothetical protein
MPTTRPPDADWREAADELDLATEAHIAQVLSDCLEIQRGNATEGLLPEQAAMEREWAALRATTCRTVLRKFWAGGRIFGATVFYAIFGRC